MSYAERLDADRRLAILQLLVQDEGHSNESVIEVGLLDLAHRRGVDRAYVRDQLRTLEKAGAIRLEFYRDTVMVAHLTERGVAIADGRVRVDGISKPALGE